MEGFSTVESNGGKSGAALEGLVVLDLASHVAGPSAARYLGDFGADVIKIERPVTGDAMQHMGWCDKDGDSYFWRFLGRNKRCVTLDLKSADGVRVFRKLVEKADVLVENLRPGGLEKLGLDPALLFDIRPSLVVLRVSGYGQTGPYSSLPAFATSAEAIAGYAALSGEPGGRPLLAPLPLADEVTALAGAFATMVAVRHAESTGEGQTVDVNLADTMVQLLGPLISVYAHEGILQSRMGSALPYTAPRGTYLCKDGKWVALSASSDGVATRLRSLLGCASDDRFATGDARIANAESLDELIDEWMGLRDQRDALATLRQSDIVAAPVYGVDEIVADRHFRERETVTTVDEVTMQGLVAHLSRTPGVLRFPGRGLGADQQFLDRFLSEARE